MSRIEKAAVFGALLLVGGSASEARTPMHEEPLPVYLESVEQTPSNYFEIKSSEELPEVPKDI